MRSRLALWLVAGLSVIPAFGSRAPASPPRRVIFDDDGFKGAVPSGYKASSDFARCEYKRSSRDGRHLQHIYSGTKDRCEKGTTGAPGKGDVSIYRSYDASEGEVYKAWAQGYVFNGDNARATVKLIYFDDQASPKGIAECWDRTESSDSVTMETGEFKRGLHGRPKPEVTDSNGCVAPNGTDGISVHFRIHAVEKGASGKAVLERLKFGRCKDDGDCSNVPGF